MSAGQTVLHLRNAFGMALGDPRFPQPPTPTLPSPLNSRIGRHLVLRTPLPWPHNVPTLPALDASRQAPPPPDAFDVHLADLLAILRHFAHTPASGLLPAHPFLGPLTRDEWMRWGYLHTDHHLRQFRC